MVHTLTSTTTWDTASPCKLWFPGSIKSHGNLETKQPLDEKCESHDPHKFQSSTKWLTFHWGRSHIVNFFSGQIFLSKIPRGSLWLPSGFPILSSQGRSGGNDDVLSSEECIMENQWCLPVPSWLSHAGMGERDGALSTLAFLTRWLQRKVTCKLGALSLPLTQGSLLHSTQRSSHFSVL